MTLLASVFVVLLLNFLIGVGTGFLICNYLVKTRQEFDEKTVYCHGFEDGIYFTIDEYNPDMFKIEIAENSYREYKAIKNGPKEH
jgi:hypothetical protein